VSLYNPAGLFELSVEVMVLSQRDPAAARVKLAAMQDVLRGLVLQERRQAEAAAAAGLHRTAVGHETVAVMALRSFPCLPEGSIELQRSYLRLAGSYAALGQLQPAAWATQLAQGHSLRYGSEMSCQLPVLPGLYHAYLPAEPGWFVEVGAYDGVTFSNTANLAGSGWRGLYIEPHAFYLDLCRRQHAGNPGIRFENCAIGRTAGEGVLRDAGAMSTVASAGAPEGAAETPVAIVRLETLLEKHGVPHGFEVLVIDVEGHEEEVFDSFDLAVWRPRLVIVELGNLDLATPQPDDQRWRSHAKLIGHDYGIVYQDDVNTVYCAAPADG
jgi:FkbM family methyltransferase